MAMSDPGHLEGEPEREPGGEHEPDWRAGLAAAVGFFTILPIGAGRLPLASAAWAFPVAGALVGGIGGVVYMLAHGLGLGPFAAAVAAIAAIAVLTGALHEDGLADTADGLGARGGRDARLVAMRDSGIGAFGMLALIVVVLGRVAALAELGSPAALGALIAAGALSRAGLALLLQALPPARADGLGHAAGTPTVEAVLAAVVIATMIAWPAVGLLATVVALVVGGLALWLVMALARRLFGGQTGDILGAAQQVTELLVLYAVAALA